jgi:hypothetical protein
VFCFGEIWHFIPDFMDSVQEKWVLAGGLCFVWGGFWESGCFWGFFGSLFWSFLAYFSLFLTCLGLFLVCFVVFWHR